MSGKDGRITPEDVYKILLGIESKLDELYKKLEEKEKKLKEKEQKEEEPEEIIVE
jgi:hypothetical protein